MAFYLETRDGLLEAVYVGGEGAWGAGSEAADCSQSNSKTTKTTKNPNAHKDRVL